MALDIQKHIIEHEILRQNTWVKTGSNIYYLKGLVGIGTSDMGDYNNNGAEDLIIYNEIGGGLTIDGDATHVGKIHFNSGTGLFDVDGFIQYDHTSDSFRIGTAGGERVRIDSAGNVGIGTASPSQELDIHSTNAAEVLLRTFSADIYGSEIGFFKSRSATKGVYTETLDNDRLGAIDWYGVDSGDTLDWSAALVVEQDGDAIATAVPTRFMFLVSDGLNNPSEVMRIDSAGNVGIGETSPDELLHITSAGSITALKIEDTTNSQSITIGHGNTVAQILSDSSAYLQIGVGAHTDAIVIDAAGEVGIGTTAPASELHIKDPAGDALLIVEGIGTAKDARLGLIGDNTGVCVVRFGDDDNETVGQIHYSHVSNAFTLKCNAINRAVLNAAGDLTIDGHYFDGTCEIFTEDALAIIEDVMTSGSGELDKYGHERFDMPRLEVKYPYLINKQEWEDEEKEEKEIKYFQDLGATEDILFRAVQQLNAQVKELKAEIELLKNPREVL